METFHLYPSDIARALDLIRAATLVAEAPNARTVTRYGVTYCVDCGLAIAYCAGHAPAPPPAKDGAESSLAKRVADCQGGK